MHPSKWKKPNSVTERKIGVFFVKCALFSIKVGPGTGNQFSSDDVGNCLSDLRFSQFLTFYICNGEIFFKVHRFFRGQDV